MPLLGRTASVILALLKLVRVTVRHEKGPVRLERAYHETVRLGSRWPVEETLMPQIEAGLHEGWRCLCLAKWTVEDNQCEVVARPRAVYQHNSEVADAVGIEVAGCRVRTIIRDRPPPSTKARPHLLNVLRAVAVVLTCDAVGWVT